MGGPRPRGPAERRRRLRTSFDRRVRGEWGRYSGESRRVLRRVVRERFLGRHLHGVAGIVLELGPGPGRFTPILREPPRRRVIGVDLSARTLRSARRRTLRSRSGAPVDWVQGAGEHLPFADRSFDVAVAFGNIICFAAKDGERLLRELSRVLRPGGLLLVDFSSPASAIQEFLANEANHRGLARILRRPDHYFLHRALRTGYQPYAPARLAQFEFQFYTVDEAVRALRSAGFRPVDTMSIAPLAAHHERVAAIARREPRTWRTLLELEETVGRRNGALEIGHGFAIAARRASARAPSSVGRSRSTVRPSAKRSPRVARSHPARSPTDGPASTRT